MTKKVPKKNKTLSYKDAGVDLEAGYKLIEKIKPSLQSTTRPEILSKVGSFSAFSKLPPNIENPVLVTCTDGVGTKIEIAKKMKVFNTIGIDLVAMCVNDLITCGAEPIVFLDYYVTDSLNIDTASKVISGIAQGCKLARCSLVGGETAEHPDSFPDNSFDLAGFSVGIVDEKKIIKGNNAKEGDVLIGLASTGVHSNGFSLIRKIISSHPAYLEESIGGESLGERLLTPTRIYVNEILELIKKIDVTSIAHITGGGLYENIPRILEHQTKAKITFDGKDWPNQDLFDLIQQKGNISDNEMLSTFNCGVGMVISLKEKDMRETLDVLEKLGIQAKQLGTVQSKSPNESSVVIV